MPALVNIRGDDDFYSEGGSLCSGDSGIVFSIGSHVEIYCPPRKRSRISGPYIVGRDIFEDKRPSIDVLPDECLFEIFRHLPGGRERSASACVSKRWLTVLSSVRSSEFNRNKIPQGQPETISIEKAMCGRKKSNGCEACSYCSWYIQPWRTWKTFNPRKQCSEGISNFGLSAIARGCPSLRVLSLWNVPSIGDEGIFEIARECHSLEKLDLCQCPSISNRGLAAIAESCPNLASLTIESCPNIGNESLQAIAKFCPKLQSITIKDCALVRDLGIASLLSSSTVLTKVKLQALNITDYSVAVIGHYGKSITNLVLCGLQNVSQKGFWVMGNAKGLQTLSSLTITSCRGVTDLSLEAVGRGCPNLKHMCLRKCCFVSDNGLVAFAKAAGSLESLQLEEVNRITQLGILTALSSCISKLKSVSLVKCMGIKDLSTEFPMLSPCESLRCLSIRSCPGFGSTSLAVVGKLCPQLHHLDLSGLCGITDAGLLPLLESSLARLHGETLELLNLDGCQKITDASLAALADSCPLLNDLDVSKCSITDSGVVALSHGSQHNLQILSFSGCSMITNKSRPALEQLGRTLVGLNLQHCNSISSNTIESLTENLWRCDILS
ncbi:UNVERIFIED_CONTAM: EIN3-binding F-box protein 1 [Sesamum latifolium]|uniref:EIN3-binding F-box protein 1 n=1 Tax=Sesamum latifolium TaxID=2727402 RepID=A0AAW2VBI5_9LAMI